MLEIKYTVTIMKNALVELIIRLDTAKERISEFEEVWVETSQIEKQEIFEQNIPKLWDKYKGITCT